MTRNYKNATLADTLGNIFGDEGIKADVAVKIAPATIPIIIVSIVAAIIIGSIASKAIMNAIGMK